MCQDKVVVQINSKTLRELGLRFPDDYPETVTATISQSFGSVNITVHAPIEKVHISFTLSTLKIRPHRGTREDSYAEQTTISDDPASIHSWFETTHSLPEGSVYGTTRRSIADTVVEITAHAAIADQSCIDIVAYIDN